MGYVYIYNHHLLLVARIQTSRNAYRGENSEIERNRNRTGERRSFGHNLFISEPSGRTAPKGTGDGLNKYRGVEGESLALACAAQGFPAPITRYTHLRIRSLTVFFSPPDSNVVLTLRGAQILYSLSIFSILTLYPVSGGGTVRFDKGNEKEPNAEVYREMFFVEIKIKSPQREQDSGSIEGKKRKKEKYRIRCVTRENKYRREKEEEGGRESGRVRER